ncbi:MAG: hypothetical protein NDF54_04890 [archaeon GB-1867-035]|nr:hypothetical protein [Candidatus Culexmicrobium profundum]
MKIVIEIEEPYNLDLTMKPSFLSSLYEKVNGWWIKKIGFLAGSFKLKQEGNFLIAEYNGDLDYKMFIDEVKLESGLWHNPFEHYLGNLSKKVRESVSQLSKMFPGVRLAISPRDFNLIFIGALLSKRTRYEVFVKKWFHRLWSSFRCDFKVIANLSLRELSIIGSSYQIFHLKRTLKDYLALYGDKIMLNESSFILRRKLMYCWGVGPKVADATLLFTRQEPEILPVDTHLVKATRCFNWVDKFKLPTKNLCLKYVCNENESKLLKLPICPLSLNNLCLRKQLTEIFGKLSGWIQTLTYLAGSKIKRYS